MNLARGYLKAIYRLWAKIYDNYLDKLFAFDRQAVINKLGLLKNSVILEIGVGTGLNIPYFPEGVRLFGVDFSSAMLKEARHKSSRAQVELICADAHRLNFPDNFFTHALATYTLRVSPRKIALLKEISRVVKPRGRLVVLDEFRTWNWLSAVKLTLGWGRDVPFNELIADTDWKVVSRDQIGRSHTMLIVLENDKNTIVTY